MTNEKNHKQQHSPFVEKLYKGRLPRIHIQQEGLFRKVLLAVGCLMVGITLFILFTLFIESRHAIATTGGTFFVSSEWDPVHNQYGALAFLAGTLITAFLALLISIPFSFSVAVALGEYFPKGWFADALSLAVELIAAIPSVIYGFWGIAVLVPAVRHVQSALGMQPIGYGLFTSALVLAIMIIPYSASLGRSMIAMVPLHLKEAAYALGATRWEVVRYVVVPYTRSGLFAGILLSLGRALGETMAVTMVIGNTVGMPKGLFSTGNTLASVIANELGEADRKLYNSALIELGLVLFVVTLIINLLGRRVMKQLSH